MESMSRKRIKEIGIKMLCAYLAGVRHLKEYFRNQEEGTNEQKGYNRKLNFSD
jgi:hypothetical protein